MAKIEKMLISGIRSYPPDGNSVIEFQTPLTLIVGPNGTGKTSIIESLKFITTGDLPPGTKGGAFVHDPKVAHEKEVKGQVKLRFVDITGNRINCIRSMVSIQKPKKIETKSLEGVIVKITEDGTRESISSRCTDFTKEMISRLGVSKAVLDNVIFCHQEDACWPLSEGKTLKTKFDAIFAATRYIQALEAIRNVRKQQGADVKIYNTELDHLVQVKDQAVKVTSDLNKAQAQMLSASDQMTKIADALNPIEDQLKELDNISSDVFRVEKDISNIQSKRELLTKNVNELDENIENKFNGSYNELLRLQSEFGEKLEREENSLNDLQTVVRRLNIELERLDQNKTTLVKENGRLLQEEQNFKETIQVKNRLVKSMGEEFGVTGYESGTYDEYQTDAFVKSMQDLFKVTVTEGKKSRDFYANQTKELETKIKSFEKSLHAIQGGMEQKKKIINENNKKLQDVNDTLNSLRASENRLQRLDVDLKTAEDDLVNMKSEIDISRINNDIDELVKSKKEESANLTKLREEETLMIQQSKSQTKVDMLSRDKTSKEESIQSIVNRHEESMERLFDTRPPLDEFKSTVTQYLRKKQSEIKRHNQEYEEVKSKVTTKESQRKMLRKQYQEKEEKKTRSYQKLEEVCADNDYTEFRDQIQKKVEHSQGALVEIGAFEKIYDKYISQLNQHNSQDKGCPLCHRKFGNAREIRNLIEELNQKLHNVPEKREQHQHSLDESIVLQDKLLHLAPVKSTYDEILDELPKLKKNIDELNNDIENEKEKLSTVSEAKVLLEEQERTVRSMEADVNRIDDYIYDLKELERQLSVESGKLHGIKPGRTMTAVRSEVQEKQGYVDGIGRKVDQKRQKLMEHQQQISVHEKNVNDLKSQKLKLQSELQRRLQLENQEKELSSSNKQYDRELREAQKQLAPINSDLKEACEEKKDLEMTRETSEEETRSRLQNIKIRGEKLREKISAIKSYINEGKETAIEDNKQQLKSLEERFSKKVEECENKKKDILKIQENKTKQELRVREIDDNLRLIKTEKEIQSIDIEIVKLKKELSKFGDYKVLSNERSSLQQQLDGLRKDKAIIEGRLKGYEDEVKRCERDLASSLYAGAEGRHCNKMIQVRTTELASEDLDKYYKALDRAIMRYHSLKLDEINKIVKEYWLKTYRGNDIDTIEIVSEHDDEGSGASKARRNYNYRVCMKKKDISLDMRGRCSAGQKVLASIIIRLALAETFCLNCGILALDEPTTNLDEANIKSLANALRGVIEMRMQQKNFQLIVITHDEDFVRALGRGADYVENYFAVYKDDNGNSKIHKKRIELRE